MRQNGVNGFATYAAGTGAQPVFYKLSTKTLSSIAVSGSYQTAYYVDDAINHTGVVVTATFSDASERVVTGDAVFVDPSTATTGAKTVTVKYSYKGVEKTTTYGITVSERPKFTVTFADDSSSLTEASVGAGVELPDRSDSDPWSFAGWAVANIASSTTTAPAAIYDPGDTYYPTANITLYPVYTKTGTITTWTKITDLSTVTAGTYALLTPGGYAFAGTLTSGKGDVTATTFSFTDNVATSAPSGMVEVELATKSSGFSMKILSGTNKDKYITTSKATSGGLSVSAAAGDYYWYYDSTEKWISSHVYSSKNPHMRPYGNSNINTYNSTSNGDDLTMARKGTTSATYYISDPS